MQAVLSRFIRQRTGADLTDIVQVIRDLPRKKDMPGHHRPAPFLLTDDMFGGLPIDIAGAEITSLIDRPISDPHRHDIPEIYLLVSPSPGAAVIDIELDGDTITVASPSAVFVPAGVTHRFIARTAEPGSFCFGIFLNRWGAQRPAAFNPR